MNSRVDAAARLIDLGRPAEARELLAEVLAAEPGNVKALIMSAVAARRLNDDADAARILRTALELQPDNQWALRVLAMAFTRLGRLDDAVAAAGRAVELGPAKALNHQTFAGVLRAAGRLPEALAAIDSALELDPDNAAMHLTRGQILRTAGRLPEADLALREALRIDPGSATAVHQLALNDIHTTRWFSGLRGLAAAASMDPSLGSDVRHRAVVIVNGTLALARLALLGLSVLTLLVAGGWFQLSDGGRAISLPLRTFIGIGVVVVSVAVVVRLTVSLPPGSRRLVAAAARPDSGVRWQVAHLICLAASLVATVITGSFAVFFILFLVVNGLSLAGRALAIALSRRS